MQAFFEQIMVSLGQPFAIPNPTGEQENCLLITHTQGIFLVVYSNDCEADKQFFECDLGVYCAVLRDIPYLVIAGVDGEGPRDGLFWTINSYSIVDDQRWTNWLAQTANEVTLWLVDNQTGTVEAGRTLSPSMAGAMLQALKPFLENQRAEYYDEEAVYNTVESTIEAFGAYGLIAAVIGQAQNDVSWYRDELPAPQPKASPIIQQERPALITRPEAITHYIAHYGAAKQRLN